jgi:Zn-dependent protease
MRACLIPWLLKLIYSISRFSRTKNAQHRYALHRLFCVDVMTTFLLVLFLWIFSVCMHEYGHAIVAYRGGDRSVKDKGYLSLNPMRYLDPMTSVILPTVLLVMGGLGLPGGAVYIDTQALKSKAWESAVAVAGVTMNLFLLIVTAVFIKLFSLEGSMLGAALSFFALLQASSIVLNLLPLPGFDGYAALDPHLPNHIREIAHQFAPYTFFVFLLVIFMVPGVSQAIWVVSFGIASLTGIDLSEAIAGLQSFRFWKN